MKGAIYIKFDLIRFDRWKLPVSRFLGPFCLLLNPRGGAQWQPCAPIIQHNLCKNYAVSFAHARSYTHMLITQLLCHPVVLIISINSYIFLSLLLVLLLLFVFVFL